MKTLALLLLSGVAFTLGRTTYRGGTADTGYYDVDTVHDASRPEASPTFRPGMYRDDPRDSQFNTHPQIYQNPGGRRP